VIDLCDSPQHQQQHNAADANNAEACQESEEDQAAYRRRGFLVGGGVCSMRIRLHHLLQHWPYKVSGWAMLRTYLHTSCMLHNKTLACMHTPIGVDAACMSAAYDLHINQPVLCTLWLP
jgi:hypothetical protein